MTRQHRLGEFSERIGYSFRNPDLLEEALTHPSVRSPVSANNQRLEFLGDRVIGLLVADLVLERYPEANEGELATRFNALVCGETCVLVAREIGLGTVLLLDGSATSGGEPISSALEDGLEALVAGVYRDGGIEPARRLVNRLWRNHLDLLTEDSRNSKSRLQEWAQARGMAPPEYREVDRSGPDHAPLFTVEAVMADGRRTRATATSIRKGQRKAADAMLANLDATE